MKTVDRYKKIETLLKERGELSVSELAEKTNVSEATIRRDLVRMEKKQMISRFWGGAKISNTSEIGPDYLKDEHLLKYSKNYNTKRMLAKYAASLIPDGSQVYIDAGSTLYHMFEFITAKDIVIITNNIYNLQLLAQKQINTFIPQGFINFGAASIMSAETASTLSQLNYNLAFLGTMGIDSRNGYTSTDRYDSDLKKAVAQNSDQVYVLSDSSKFNVRKLFTFIGLDSATLITNEAPPFPVENCIIVNDN